jgi:RTX calcium-binding nonapeptide repeat (4 copies)
VPRRSRHSPAPYRKPDRRIDCDTFFLGAGADLAEIQGGGGNDTLDWSGSAGPVTASLASSSASGVHAFLERLEDKVDDTGTAASIISRDIIVDRTLRIGSDQLDGGEGNDSLCTLPN